MKSSGPNNCQSTCKSFESKWLGLNLNFPLPKWTYLQWLLQESFCTDEIHKGPHSDFILSFPSRARYPLSKENQQRGEYVLRTHCWEARNKKNVGRIQTQDLRIAKEIASPLPSEKYTHSLRFGKFTRGKKRLWKSFFGSLSRTIFPTWENISGGRQNSKTQNFVNEASLKMLA